MGEGSPLIEIHEGSNISIQFGKGNESENYLRTELSMWNWKSVPEPARIY